MAILGVSLAPADLALAPTPTWERIDTTYNVQTWTIDRGRPNEMSRTGTGTAHIELVDRTGDFDPTNPGGAFYGRLEAGVPMGPLVQAAIALQNPVSLAWSTLFRGFISSIQWVPYQTEEWANVTIDLVDALGILAAAEMPLPPLGNFGDDYAEGNIIFNEDLGTNAVQTRINNVLDRMGWPSSLRSIFTGRVGLMKTVVAPRTTVLTVLQDCADADFPDIANLFVGGPPHPGFIVYHGRLARFDPTNPSYGLTTWHVGDDTAAAVSPSTVVRISPPLVASLDDSYLYTSALAGPQPVPGTDIDLSSQYVQDAGAVATKGLRTWSAENLLTAGGVGPTTALEETKKFATYVRDNYPTPRVRVGQVTIKPRRPASINGPATWALLCGIDISDVVHLKTTHHGGGGFNTDFYVEGIHYVATPGPGDFHIVELTLDLSPKGYYNTPIP